MLHVIKTGYPNLLHDSDFLFQFDELLLSLKMIGQHLLNTVG